MDDPSVARVLRALGPEWATFRATVAEWLGKNRERLSSNWDFPLDDAELLNHELGVFIHDPRDPKPVEFDYDATPRDSFAFASTGVDGEHYSVLLDEGCAGVIVMTAPMAFGSEHVVVGESLSETLALVSRGGGLALPPNLAYCAWDTTITTIEQQTDSSLWRELRDVMGLTAWPDPAGRLAQLRDEHLSSVHRRRT